MTSTEQRDLIEVLVANHREVEETFNELELHDADTERRRQLVNVAVAELVRHAVVEEEYLYPTVRRVLPNGDKLADGHIAEHDEAERTMKELEGVEPTDPALEHLLAGLIQTMRSHLREEENDLFPQLRSACDEQELRELGQKAELARKLAPTRPHPSTPDSPMMKKMLAPGVGLVDRIRDALGTRATKREDV